MMCAYVNVETFLFCFENSVENSIFAFLRPGFHLIFIPNEKVKTTPCKRFYKFREKFSYTIKKFF